MKKHKPIKSQPLFRKEKDYLKIINNPSKLSMLKDLVAQATKTTEKIVKPEKLNDWMVYAISILPHFENDVEFVKKLGALVDEYSDERKGSDTVESC